MGVIADGVNGLIKAWIGARFDFATLEGGVLVFEIGKGLFVHVDQTDFARGCQIHDRTGRQRRAKGEEISLTVFHLRSRVGIGRVGHAIKIIERHVSSRQKLARQEFAGVAKLLRGQAFALHVGDGLDAGILKRDDLEILRIENAKVADIGGRLAERLFARQAVHG